MIFFCDENVCPSAARMLDLFDHRNEVRALEDYFARGTLDVDWIPEVASWEGRSVAVTGDSSILRNKVERHILRECNLTFVYLARAWSGMKWNDYAWKIVKAWPAVITDVERTLEPAVYEVQASGKVRRIGGVSSL